MSHLTSMKANITDIQTVTQVCDELGWTLVQGGEMTWWSGTKRVDYVVSGFHRNRSMGLVRNANGGYDIVCDDMDTAAVNKFKQQHSVETVKASAKRKRLTVQQEQLTNGTVRVTLRGRF